MRFGRICIIVSCVWVSILLLTGCNVTKHLDKDKTGRVLVKNTLNFTPQSHVGLGKRSSLRYETLGLFRQKPNRRFLMGYPRLAAHYKYRGRTSKFANFVNKAYAEEPTEFKEEQAQISASYFQNFMRKRGYFNAVCTYEVKNKKDHYVEVVYTLDLGTQYKISEVNWISKDTNIAQVLQKTRKDSELKPGVPVDNGKFDAEKYRVVNTLRNYGYAQMVPNFVEFTGDSTQTQVKVDIEVLPYTNEHIFHPRFTVGSVQVFSSLVPDVNSIRNDDTIRNIYYYSNEERFFVKPKYLDQVIKVRPGTMYRQEDLDQTYRRMSNMGAFRFVSVRPKLDSLRKDTMNVGIFFAPADKSSIGYDFDLRYTTLGLIGVPASVFYKHRNVFGGAELLQTSLTANVDFDIRVERTNPLFLWEGKFQNNLVLPRFFDYMHLWKGLHGLRLKNKRAVNDRMYDRLRNEAKTRMGLNMNVVNVTNFYSSGQLDATFGYDLNAGGVKSYAVNHIGVDWLQYFSFDPTFDAILLKSPLFAKRTSNQLFTGFFLRSFTYNYRSRLNSAGERYVMRFSSDVSGWEVELLNRLIAPDKIWKLNNQLDFAKYVRLELGGSYSRNFSKEILAGINVNTGIIVPFGSDAKNRTSPYVKQFFMGGPSGLRAWRIRDLGPGTYYDAANDTISPKYQASDIKLEFTSEVRFPIFWYFKGAVFLDGGNIWSLRSEAERPGSKWYRNSYKDIALGSGFGLRFDFGYSVIRFDWGIRLREPYLREGYTSHWVLGKQPLSELSNFNIAVGYPF